MSEDKDLTVGLERLEELLMDPRDAEAIWKETIDYNLDQIDVLVFRLISVIFSQDRLIGQLRYEVEQGRRQRLNLEGRLFTLEQKKGKLPPKYKEYDEGGEEGGTLT